MSLEVINDGKATVGAFNLPPPCDLPVGKIAVIDCKNTHFGTKLDCHGNLTVNQFVNLSDADQGKKVFPGLIVTDCVTKPDWKEKLFKFKYVWLCLVLVSALVICVLLIPPRQEKNNPEDGELPHNYTLRLRTRPEWFSSKPKIDCKDLLIHPAKYVIVAHTVTTKCTNSINCENVIKGIQTDHLQRGYCDIGYNFVIAGDGYIYEGVGWGKFGSHTIGFNCDSIGVAFLGNYNFQKLTPKMEEAFHILIEEGMKLHEISPDFKMFGQNQVRKSESPGLHVINEMKKWKGWAEPKEDDYICFKLAETDKKL